MKQIIQIQNLNKHYGPVQILKDASLVIHEGQKIGVIGRNGAGKSTLFNILMNKETADSGQIHRARNISVGYLEQKDPFVPGETSLEYLMRVSGKENWFCGKVAGRMQLKNEILNSEISSLPGGYQMRIRLTAMLLHEPDFILLDEPTNYLDLKTLLILENFLHSFSGGFMVISHDREFLKKTCNETLEVSNGELQLFPGNIDEFFGWREDERQHVERINKGIEARQKELGSFIERFRAKASKASQARSKAKQLEKLEKISTDPIQGSVSIRIPEEPSHPGRALSLEDLSIGYGEKIIASGISHIFSKGEHVAILGDNGEGKSTLLKTLFEKIPPLGGSFKWGTNTKTAYYAQHVFNSLNEKDTVLEHLKKTSGNKIPDQKILDMAGSFLFQGDDVNKSVSVLSGGERSRLLLAGLLLSNSNVFLFDEPTNHLDFETVEALGIALKNYGGTLFFISHDRTFVNMVASAILEIREGQISLYRGDYEDYVYALERRILEDETSNSSVKPEFQDKEKKVYHVRKELQSDIRKAKVKSETLEKSIKSLEEKQLEKQNEILKNYSLKANEELMQITHEIEKNENEWMLLQESIEVLEKKLETSAV